MKRWSLLILAVVIAIQFAVTASLIAKHERVLRQGELHRFKTRPIDPADPFQGRYVRLAYEQDYVPGTKEHEPEPRRKERVYVSLSTDTNGFSRLAGWSRTRPDAGTFLKLQYQYPKREWNRDTRTSTYKGLAFKLPFNRFYMEESKAPRAEKEVLTATRNTNCWATVRILDGVGLVENVYVSGQSIRELVEARAAK